MDDNDQELSVVEQDSLYNLIGYCIHSIRNTEKTCEKCLQEVTTSTSTADFHERADLTLLKEHTKGKLHSASDGVYEMLHQVKIMFRKAENHLMEAKNVKMILEKEAEILTRDFKLPTCHDIKNKLIRKFISVRLHFYCRKKNDQLKMAQERKWKGQFRSKSVTMRKFVQTDK